MASSQQPSQKYSQSAATSPLRPVLLQAEKAQFPYHLLTGQVLKLQQSLWPSGELTPICQCPSCTGEPRTGLSLES